MIERAFAQRFGGPNQFSGGEIDRQQAARIAHQHQVAHGQRMQTGKGGHVLVVVWRCRNWLDQLLDRRMMGHADAPARIEQRTAAVRRSVVPGIAAIHQPIFTFDVMDFPRPADLIFQPGQRLRSRCRTASPVCRQRARPAGAIRASAPPAPPEPGRACRPAARRWPDRATASARTAGPGRAIRASGRTTARRPAAGLRRDVAEPAAAMLRIRPGCKRIGARLRPDRPGCRVATAVSNMRRALAPNCNSYDSRPSAGKPAINRPASAFRLR